MNNTIIQCFISQGWEYLDSMPLFADNGDHIGDLYNFTKNDQSIDITHYFYYDEN